MRLPLRLRQWLFHRTLRLTVGDLTRFGLPRPTTRSYETHPIANSQLVYYARPRPDQPGAGRGPLRPRTTVELTDGRRIEPDLVVLATGYLPRFEFLAPELLGDDGDGRPDAATCTPSPPATRRWRSPAWCSRTPGSSRSSHWQTRARSPGWLRLRATDPRRAAAFAAAGARRAGAALRRARSRTSSRHWFEVGHVDYLRAVQRALDGLEKAA